MTAEKKSQESGQNAVHHSATTVEEKNFLKQLENIAQKQALIAMMTPSMHLVF